MASSQAAVAALDIGHNTFENFLAERFDELQADLLRECNRIAVARELAIRQKLDKAEKENQDLREINQSFSRPDMQLEGISSDQVDVSVRVEEDKDAHEAAASRANVVSLDTLIEVEQNPKHSFDLPATQQQVLYNLWTEWQNPGEKQLMHKQHAETLDLLLAQTESAMEIDWLHGHDHAKHSDTNGRTADHKATCTLSPNSACAMCWDITGIPVLFYDLITVPLGVFSDMAGNVPFIFNWTITIYWTLDMFLRFLVIGYVTGQGQIERNRSHIMMNYLRHAFIFDLAMVAPDWISQVIGAPRNLALLRTFRLVRLSRIMRMSKLKAITRQLQDSVDSEYFAIVSNIAGNLIAIVGWCHYLGCFWFWLGSQEVQGYPSWVEAADLEYAHWPFQYMVSMHWAITQFTPASSTIGPENIPETGFAIIVLIFGMLFFSLFISGLTQDRIHLQALRSKIDKANWTLRKYLRQRGISADLTLRAIRYVDTSVAPMMQRVQRKDVMLLDYLSRPLQLEVQAELFYNTLLIHQFLQCLREHSGALTSSLFTRAVHNTSLAHDDLLFTVGQVCHEMFFLEQGTLAYLPHATNTIVKIRPCRYFCEMVIWVPWVHVGTAKAASEVQIVSVDSASLRTIVLEHKERAFVRKCAEAYLKDLNDYIEAGLPLTDMLDVIALENSRYMECVQSC